MSKPVIRVENLGKKYLLKHQQAQRYVALRDVIVNSVKSFGRNLLSPPAQKLDPTREEFWALKDVSFEVNQGDRIGIIGRNGAGKSTLLKILSRITEPTTGQISLRGRVASLLEVGTGFHPELTGRENIYLNGAILGMTRTEIRRKFDEIVAFAEVEKFLDTPVKHYSSGMYVRLAFAVAAHLEPEILVVDEVLAVGDAEFQKKCLGKMKDVAQNEGRTVLFVSHQMAIIERLCSTTILLSSGEVKFNGVTKEAINFYLKDLEDHNKSVDIASIYRSGTGDLILASFSLEDSAGKTLSAVSSGEEVILVFGYKTKASIPLKNVSIGISIHTITGERLCVFYSDYAGVTFDVSSPSGKFKCRINDFPFSHGKYFVAARAVASGIELDWPHEFVGSINVQAGDFYGTGNIGHSGIGPILIRGVWELQ